MTSIEKAEWIIREHNCCGFTCSRDGTKCPFYSGKCQGYWDSGCIDSRGIEFVKDWLAKNDPDQNEIIGWPGNAEEMKQYIGRQCICCDRYSFKGHSAQGKLAIKYDPDMPYTNEQCGDGFIFCKILPEPTVTEYTIQEIADKLGVPVESIRIKD